MEQSIIASSALDISVPVPTGGSEALRELTDHAARRKADELAATLAERALRVTRGADFAVARDALDALLRRLESDHCHIQAARLINPVDQGTGKNSSLKSVPVETSPTLGNRAIDSSNHDLEAGRNAFEPRIPPWSERTHWFQLK